MKVFDVTVLRVNSFQTIDLKTMAPTDPHLTRVFMDSGESSVGSDAYEVIEGSFTPCPFELGKRYRITVEEVTLD